jgi:hypothetical protein
VVVTSVLAVLLVPVVGSAVLAVLILVGLVLACSLGGLFVALHGLLRLAGRFGMRV